MSVTYEQARAALAEQLNPPAVEHSERVARTAAWLASHYGVSETDAALAGLLHDWHRETEPEQLVARARELDLDVTEVDETVPYLLHGPVAAAELDAHLPGVTAEIRDAIAVHTYGASDMSPLAMVLYIADVIEPSREHPGVDELRDAVGTMPIDELFAVTYAQSLRHLIDSRRRIHPQTVATWNDIAERSSK